jgi:hypothetical protein
MKSDNSNGSVPNNVIDMTERIPSPLDRLGLSGLKVRFDLEHAKIAVSTSLLSIVILVTLANNNLMTSINPVVVPIDEAVPNSRGLRGIASVPGADQVASAIPEDPLLVKTLARRGLGPTASVGQSPSALDRLAFGFFEGKYAVRLHAGKIREIEFSSESNVSDAKEIINPLKFLETQRDLLPEFARTVKVGDSRDGADQIKTFELVNEVSIPVAKVEFRVTDESRLLGMRVTPATDIAK